MSKIPLSLKDWLSLLKQTRMICYVEAFEHELEEVKRSATRLVDYHAYTEEGERIKFTRFKVTDALGSSRQVP
jgi:hypothetical protein